MKKYRKYTLEAIEFIKQNYETMRCKEMVKILNEEYSLNINIASLYNFKQTNGLTTKIPWNKGTKGLTKGNSGSFKKGNVPKNKGTKGLSKPNKTSFKKGNIPDNIREVGSERITKDGYIEIKVAEPNKWNLKHRVVYEKHFGKIPKGKIIVFLDRNIQNLSIDNLECITKHENLIMNKRGYYSIDPEITKTGLNAVRLEISVKKKRKEVKNEYKYSKKINDSRK